MVIRRTTNRRAFTLTEMMVATALTLFLMAIISAAFRAGLDTFSKLNTANQLQQKLSNVKKVIQRDMAAEHFEGPYQPGFSGPRLSDQRMNRVGYRPPAKGYFTLSQIKLAEYEPFGAAVSDGENLYSTKNDGCFFSFTMKNPSTGYADQFAGRLKVQQGGPVPVPALPFLLNDTVYSPWAQVHYFLAPTGDTTDPGPSGTQLPLYSLRRQLFVLAPDEQAAQMDIPVNAAASNIVRNVRVTAGSLPNTVRLVSASQVQLARYVDPSNPLTPLAAPTADPNGDDILLVNVLNFEVKVWWDGLTTPVFVPIEQTGLATDTIKRPILNAPQTAAPRYSASYPPILHSQDDLTATDWPFSDLPSDTVKGWNSFPRTFDTWFRNIGNEPDWDTLPANGNGQPPLRIRVKAIQIKVRIWDQKTKQARQVTFIQEV